MPIFLKTSLGLWRWPVILHPLVLFSRGHLSIVRGEYKPYNKKPCFYCLLLTGSSWLADMVKSGRWSLPRHLNSSELQIRGDRVIPADIHTQVQRWPEENYVVSWESEHFNVSSRWDTVLLLFLVHQEAYALSPNLFKTSYISYESIP